MLEIFSVINMRLYTDKNNFQSLKAVIAAYAMNEKLEVKFITPEGTFADIPILSLTRKLPVTVLHHILR